MADLKTFVDIDNDGDLDAVLSGQYYSYSEGIVLVENIGTSAAPSFSSPVSGPFVNLQHGGYPYYDRAIDASFADIDADGDQDLLYIRDMPSGPDELTFSLNIGTPALADFSAPESSPYADATLSSYTFHSVEAADIDNDGDVDILIGAYYDYAGTKEARLLFYENTGTPTAPAFAPRVANPFDLTFPGTYAWGTANTSYMGGVGVAAGDIDGDGDLDLLVGPYVSSVAYNVYQSTLLFFENTGAMVDVVQ